MSSILVLQASLEINLSPITERLWQGNIPHRVIMNGNSQDLWVARPEDAEQVKLWVEEWKAGQLSAKPDAAEKTPWQVNLQASVIKASSFPVTVVMLIALIVIFTFQQFGLIVIGDWLLQPHFWSGEKFDLFSFWDNDFYRWWSPAFVHLSLMHLLMNSFWWWVLGKEIETCDGHLSLISLTLILAIGAGFAQYLAVGPFFAGLSGVTYGLMGWAWGRHNFKQTRYQLPSWLFPFMMISMLVMILVDSAGMEMNIGHESHLAGAVIGVLLALLWPRNTRHIVREESNKHIEGDDNDR